MRSKTLPVVSRTDRHRELLDASVVRLLNAITAAEQAEITVRWREEAEAINLWRRAVLAPYQTITPPGHVLCVSLFGQPLAESRIQLNRAVRERAGWGDPRPLLRLATAIDAAVADILSTKPERPVYVAYLEQRNRVVRTNATMFMAHLGGLPGLPPPTHPYIGELRRLLHLETAPA